MFLSFAGICKCHSSAGVLQLLVVLNVRGGHGVPRWDRGIEILPAAQLAVESINRDLSFLPEYILELVPVDTGICTPTSDFSSEASTLISFVNQITQEKQHIVGVVGLFCTSIAELISPLAGHRGISLLQIAGSASPILHNEEKYPYLWHMIPSSTAYVEAVYRIMDEFGWTNIAVIGSGGGLYFHTAMAFSRYRSQGGNTSQSVDVSVLILDGQVSSVLKNLQQSRKRIVFVTVEAAVAVEIICLAYQEGMIWPNYVWIFSDHYIEDLLFYVNGVCDVDILRSALERAYLLHFHFGSSDLTPNPYANVIRDSIQAFALALNFTMSHLQAMNLTLEDYHLGNSDITDIIQSEMMSLSFTGVLGHVEFDSNQERQTRVDIIQIRNGSAVQVGSYDPVSRETLIENYSNPMGDVLNNELPRIYKHSPLPVTVLLSTVTGVCIILTTIVLVVFICYRKTAEVKATSLTLSLFMFLGCYLLFISTLFHTVSDAIVNHGPFFCSTVIWCAGLGINFIFGSILVRMLRIYRIFNFFRKMGEKRWSDWFLCIVVFSIVGAEALLLLVWSVVDVFTVRDVEILQATASPPYYEVIQFCTSEYFEIWTILIFIEIGILILVVAFLAFKTRKIRQKHFKDTKKVNIYLFMNILLICVLIPFWWVLRTVNDSALSIVVLYLGYGGTAVLCQLLLFVPKVFPPLIRHILPMIPEERLRNRAIATVSTFTYIGLKERTNETSYGVLDTVQVL